jgi:integrase/recombinase XerD
MTRKAPPDRLCRPVSLWPPIDQTAWAAASTPSGPFDQRKAGSPWSPATWRKTAAGYGFFLTWLDNRGELDPDELIAERVTHQRLVAYLAYLKQRNLGHTIHNRIQELGDALRVLAPEHDWGWVSRAAGRLRAEAVPARDKLSRLRPVDELIAAGLALMDHADSAPGLSPFKRAILYRDGLMVAFLGFDPVRLRSLGCIRLGHHLQESLGLAVLTIPAEETKGRRSHEVEVAELLRQRLFRYVQRYRPVLTRRRKSGTLPTDYLWVSAQGIPLETISPRVAKATGLSGTPIRPHMFRTCAATTVAVRAPKDIHIITPILDHSGPAIGERHYNMAGSLEASRAYAEVVNDLRRGGRPGAYTKQKRMKE